MVFVDPRLMIGTVIQVKCSDSTWHEAVITDASPSDINLHPQVSENDFFKVQATVAITIVLAQNELALWTLCIHPALIEDDEETVNNVNV